MRKPLPAFARGPVLVPLLVAIDQATKFATEAFLPFQMDVPVMPFLSLFRTYNEGIAFSFLAGLDDWLLVALTVMIIAFVIWLWRQTDEDRFFANLGYGLIMGGAIGNLIDRVWLGHVVDFILFHTQTWSFAVFNMADTFITLGAAAIILDEVLDIRRSAKQKSD